MEHFLERRDSHRLVISRCQRQPVLTPVACCDMPHATRGGKTKAQAYGNALTVQAIAGTHVVLFGFDLPKESIGELMGFTIRKTHGGGQSDYLPNFLLFKANDEGTKPDHSSYLNP